MQTGIPTQPGRSGPGFREFVLLIAGLMAMNALSIDSMLPAFPQIGHALHVLRENDLQLIVIIYMLGFGIAQLGYGPLSDRFGRKPVLTAGILLYVAFSVIVSLSRSFPLLLAGRFCQGVASASTRVLAISIVRDCYSGRTMARVMSLTFMVFLAVPILAPSVGQFVLLFAGWRWIFYVLTIFGSVVLVWTGLRLPETLHPEYRRAIDLRDIASAFRLALTQRQAIGYTLISMLLNGGLMAYVSSVQQIFTDTFHAERIFPIAFALAAVGMAIGSLVNARIVEAWGMRRISHSAIIGFAVVGFVHLAIALSGRESLPLFVAMQAMQMFLLALATSNVSALAMEPLAAIAGTAASLQGFVTTVGGALIGLAIAQQFDGTAVPTVASYGVLGLGGLAVAYLVERGRLFQAHPATA
ncbi:MAG: multidrug effflux MFS transporter [Sphingomonadaceae bacterium]|nr:multidrug effflux MFS transporter [Sphingomonadaceae bacterium]